ncbi:BEM3 [Candida margitis]|uniref:BEM3 n=1 Tax=Candida margitis TaxID=1775924 RepID=UPI00222758EB|nr:BEM3 [Candida margitis]KAI5962867.1 BEM3 [Candida margitis]
MQTLNSPYIPPLEINRTRQSSASVTTGNHTPHPDYPPSDSRFDRSKLSDDEFIKQLIFENRELKSVIESQSKTITELQSQLRNHNISPKETTEITKPDRTPDKDEAPIPKKSPLKLSKPSESSLVSSGVGTPHQASTPNIDDFPLLKHADSKNNLSIKEKEASTEDKSLEVEESQGKAQTNSPYEVPMRSSRRRHIKNDLGRELEEKATSSTDDTTKSSERLMPEVSKERSLKSESTSAIIDAEVEDVKNAKESGSSSPEATKSAQQSNVSVNGIVLEHTDNTIDIADSSINDSTMLSQELKPTDSAKSNTGTTANSAASQLYSQNNKTRRSNSSVASTYKSSRIKPPGSQRTLSNSKSNAELVAPTSLKQTLNDKNDSRGNVSLYNTPPNNAVASFTGKEEPLTPDLDNESKTESFSSAKLRIEDDDLPSRPDLFTSASNTVSSQELAAPYDVSQQQNQSRPTYQTPTSSAHNIHLSSPQTPGSSFSVLHTPKMEMDESSLFIKPEEFHTIFIKVVSTIHVTSSTVQNSSKKVEEPKVTMTINDRETNKEMWRIRKTHAQLAAFDYEIRPIVEYFGLTNLPDKSSFLSTTPSKIEQRRSTLQKYFNSIFVMPHIPRMVLYKICTFLSLDFVNPLDDFKSGSRKEGFLVRRYKGLGNSWKVRWCQIESHYLEIYTFPGGPIQESISLRNAQIGRQATDSVAEDKGYRHAFLIMESAKASKLHSTASKHFFCAETDEERDDWVTALIEFTEPSSESNESSPRNTYISQDTPTDLDKRFSYDTYTNSNDSTYGNRHNGGDQSNTTVASVSSEDQAKKSKLRNYFSFRNKEASNDEQQQYSKQPQPQSQQDQDTQVHSFPYPRYAQPQQPNYTPPPSNGYYAPPQPPVFNQNSNNSVQQYLDDLNIGNDIAKSIFGRNVEEAYELSRHEYMGREIPSICYRCLDYLNKTGAVFEEGIFRLSGSASTIRQLKEIFNTQFDLDLFQTPLRPDINTVSGLFKTYLRELPNPILGASTYNHLNHIMLNNAQSLSPSQIAFIFRDFLNDPNNIDKINYDLSYIIFKFLRQIISQNQINRMNLRNVCIVFVPTLNISLEVLSTILIDFECIFENGKPISDSNREVLDLHIPNF